LQEWSQLLRSHSLFEQGLAADSASNTCFGELSQVGRVSHATRGLPFEVWEPSDSLSIKIDVGTRHCTVTLDVSAKSMFDSISGEARNCVPKTESRAFRPAARANQRYTGLVQANVERETDSVGPYRTSQSATSSGRSTAVLHDNDATDSLSQQVIDRGRGPYTAANLQSHGSL